MWKFKTGGWVGVVVASAAISDEAVYFGSLDGHLYAVDAQSGEETWKFKMGKGHVGGLVYSPALTDGVVYVGGTDSYLYAVDAQNGQEKWEFEIGGLIRSKPAVSDGVVYIGTDDGLHTLDAQSGEEKWVFRADEALLDSDDSPHDGVGHWDGSPAIFGGVVYFSSNDGYLHGLDAQSGQQKWKFETGVPEESPLAISRGVVYVGSKDGYVYAVK